MIKAWRTNVGFTLFCLYKRFIPFFISTNFTNGSYLDRLTFLGFEVFVESQAGALASFEDSAYEEAGAKVVSADEAWKSDIVFKVNAPIVDDTQNEIDLLKEGATLVSFIWPAQNPELMEHLSSRNINVMAMDSVPRIS